MSNGAPNSWVGDDFTPLLAEQIAVMLRKEESNYSCLDYLQFAGRLVLPSKDLIDEQWRQKSAEWMFKVVDFYDLDRDIVNIGMTYLDRMFTVSSLHRQWSKLECRLIAMASLKLAIKLNEPRTMNMDDMIKLGMGGVITFSAHALVEMEYEILWKLSWNTFPPTAFCFAHHLICMFPHPDVSKSTRYILQELSKYMTELAICVYSFVKFKASSKAFACVLVAMDCLRDESALSVESRNIFVSAMPLCVM